MNTTCTVRGWISEDIPELREIFAASFGDPPEVIDAFHRTFLSGPDCCAVAAVPDTEKPSGKAVAAGYLLPGPVLCFPDMEDIPAAYLYALGCLPDYRRRGFGSAVYGALLAHGEKTASPVCVLPASEALVRAYGRVCPIRPLGGSRVAELDGPRAAGAAPLAAVRLGREEYALRREECLAPYPHAAYPDAFYRLMDEYGNLFLSFPGALAAVVPLENRCVVSELLCTGADPARVIAGIAGLCPAERYEVRTPVFFPGPGEVRSFVYCHDPAGALSVPVSFWYAFGLE